MGSFAEEKKEQTEVVSTSKNDTKSNEEERQCEIKSTKRKAELDDSCLCEEDKNEDDDTDETEDEEEPDHVRSTPVNVAGFTDVGVGMGRAPPNLTYTLQQTNYFTSPYGPSSTPGSMRIPTTSTNTWNVSGNTNCLLGRNSMGHTVMTPQERYLLARQSYPLLSTTGTCLPFDPVTTMAGSTAKNNHIDKDTSLGVQHMPTIMMAGTALGVGNLVQTVTPPNTNTNSAASVNGVNGVNSVPQQQQGGVNINTMAAPTHVTRRHDANATTNTNTNSNVNSNVNVNAAAHQLNQITGSSSNTNPAQTPGSNDDNNVASNANNCTIDLTKNNDGPALNASSSTNQTPILPQPTVLNTTNNHPQQQQQQLNSKLILPPPLPVPPILTVQDQPHIPPIFNGVNPLYPNLQVLHQNPPIFQVPSFLTPQECNFLIYCSQDSFSPAPVVGKGAGEVSPSRTSSTCYLAREDLPDYLNKVSLLTGKPIDCCELPQVGRYLTSQQYLQHFDAFDLSNEDGRRFAANGGQRVVTVLTYLNDVPDGGGETYFPALDLTVTPKKGMAIVFFPATVDGLLDGMALHTARPARGTTKYVSQVWIRQGSYEGMPSKRMFSGPEQASFVQKSLQMAAMADDVGRSGSNAMILQQQQQQQQLELLQRHQNQQQHVLQNPQPQVQYHPLQHQAHLYQQQQQQQQQYQEGQGQRRQ